jgi:hypothetical protein
MGLKYANLKLFKDLSGLGCEGMIRLEGIGDVPSRNEEEDLRTSWVRIEPR